MRTVRILVVAIAMSFLLGGCVAAAIPMLAPVVYGWFKIGQTATGGSVEIGIDDTKLTNEHKAQLKNIKSMAVWPDKNGESVTFAEALSEDGGLKVISPARVAAALKKLELSDDLKLMTALEAKEVFSKVCQETIADALISSRATGGQHKSNLLSLDRANISMEFLVSIYDKKSNSYIAEIPAAVKVLVGGTMPSNKEISKLANIEIAKKITALTQSPQVSQEPIQQPVVMEPSAEKQPVEQAPPPAKLPSSKKKPSVESKGKAPAANPKESPKKTSPTEL